MFVLKPGGDNREVKAPHVPGKDELCFISTWLSLKSKDPVTHVMSFSVFGSALDLLEFNVQAHLMTDLCGVVLFYICHMQCDIQQWQCHGVYSCHRALIQENLCCRERTKQIGCSPTKVVSISMTFLYGTVRSSWPNFSTSDLDLVFLCTSRAKPMLMGVSMRRLKVRSAYQTCMHIQNVLLVQIHFG